MALCPSAGRRVPRRLRSVRGKSARPHCPARLRHARGSEAPGPNGWHLQSDGVNGRDDCAYACRSRGRITCHRGPAGAHRDAAAAPQPRAAAPPAARGTRGAAGHIWHRATAWPELPRGVRRAGHPGRRAGRLHAAARLVRVPLRELRALPVARPVTPSADSNHCDSDCDSNRCDSNRCVSYRCDSYRCNSNRCDSNR
eukprot:953467-Prymnesium_polylepis.2